MCDKVDPRACSEANIRQGVADNTFAQGCYRQVTGRIININNDVASRGERGFHPLHAATGASEPVKQNDALLRTNRRAESKGN